MERVGAGEDWKIYHKRGWGCTAQALLSQKGPEAGKDKSPLWLQGAVAAAGMDPGSPDQAGTLQAYLLSPTRQGSLEAKQGPGMGGLGSPDDSGQARAAAGGEGPGPSPSPSLLHLLSAPLPYLAGRRDP